MNKVNLILAYLEGQAKHYGKVREKYARARSILHKIAITTGSLSVALTTSGLATSLTGPGFVVGIPFGGRWGNLWHYFNIFGGDDKEIIHENIKT